MERLDHSPTRFQGSRVATPLTTNYHCQWKIRVVYISGAAILLWPGKYNSGFQAKPRCARGPGKSTATDALRSLLGPETIEQLHALCGRCLYRTLTSYVRSHDHGHFTVVSTGIFLRYGYVTVRYRWQHTCLGLCGDPG